MNYLLKIAISAVLIAGIAELGKRSTLLGALLASLPLISVLGMVWLYHDTHDLQRIAEFSHGVFWLVLPSLLLFLLLPPLLLRWQFGFYPALLLASAATVAAYFLMIVLLKRLGIAI